MYIEVAGKLNKYGYTLFFLSMWYIYNNAFVYV